MILKNTFRTLHILSRPVFIIDNKIYIGNTQQNMLSNESTRLMSKRNLALVGAL
jgi:hypothetical protein